MTELPPKLFISYSHDNQPHKDWVLQLATRLVKNGIDVILDQWDLTIGGDLPRFMESGLTTSDRVLAICTDVYVEKANSGTGGVGYEKMILTADLMKNTSTDRIIPVVRNNTNETLLPTFLSSRIYIDFRDDVIYEIKYAELLRDIHGQAINPRPALGLNPFAQTMTDIEPRLSFSPERYASPSLSGTVTFDYSNNNGRYIVGAGDMAFETAWSGGGNTAIHAYNDPPSIRSVALVTDTNHISSITDARFYDTSSRVRMPQVGEIVVWQNSSGYYLATRIDDVKYRNHNCAKDELKFTYAIAPNKAWSFSSTTTSNED